MKRKVVVYTGGSEVQSMPGKWRFPVGQNRLAAFALLGCLIAISLGDSACEFLGEAAELEGGPVEAAGAARAATVEAAGSEAAAAGEGGVRIVRSPAYEMQRAGATAAAQAAAVEFFGSEPIEGWVEHFDTKDVYQGYSYFERDAVTHYDRFGNFDGRELRSAEGSRVFNKYDEFKGTTTARGNGITDAFDEHGQLKGYSLRNQQSVRIDSFDENHRLTGYSIIRPLPNGFQVPAASFLPIALGAAARREARTSIGFFQAKSFFKVSSDQAFIDTIRLNSGPTYWQVNLVRNEAVQDTESIAYSIRDGIRVLSEGHDTIKWEPNQTSTVYWHAVPPLSPDLVGHSLRLQVSVGSDPTVEEVISVGQ